MYYYIYDSFLGQKKHQIILARIETRLTDLGINGKINRLSFLKNIYQVVAEEIKRGVDTVVVVGDDKTISQIINLIIGLNVVIGFIPIGKDLNIAQSLGIPPAESACDILSARIIKRLDLGKINNYYFFTSVELGGKDINLTCDNNYFISLPENNILNISNLGFSTQQATLPTDGLLNVFIENTKKKFWQKNKNRSSRLCLKNINITSQKSLPILITDEKRIVKTPAEVKIAPKKIRMIVGKKRTF